MRLQKTIKALVSKDISARVSAETPWYERTLFWGMFGVFLALVLFAIGLLLAAGLLPPIITVARVCLCLSLVPAYICAWIIFRHISPHILRVVVTAVTTVVVGLVLLRVEKWSTEKGMRDERILRTTPASNTPSASDIAAEISKRLPSAIRESPRQPKPRITSLDQASQHGERPKEWRQLAPWQRVKITAALAEHPGQHVLLLAYPDEETWLYASDFRDAFTAARWLVDGPKDAPKDQAALDIQLFESEEFWFRKPPVQYQKLREVLQAVGVKMRKGIQVMPDVSPEQIVVWIGPASPQQYNLENEPPPVYQMPCRSQLEFHENPIDPPDSSKGKYALLLVINAPKGPRVSNNMRLYITDHATDVGYYDRVPMKISPAGKVMPRNDVLNIEPTMAFKAGEPIPVVIVCDHECHIKCVEDLGLK